MQGVFVALDNGLLHTSIGPQGLERDEVLGRQWVVRGYLIIDLDKSLVLLSVPMNNQRAILT